MIAEVWILEKLGYTAEDFSKEGWHTVCASYAYALTVGIEAERRRRDAVELPH